MKYQIWLKQDPQIGTFTEELTAEEKGAFETLGFELKHEFMAPCKAEATKKFVAWCDEQTGCPNKVEKVDLVGALQEALEE